MRYRRRLPCAVSWSCLFSGSALSTAPALRRLQHILAAAVLLLLLATSRGAHRRPPSRRHHRHPPPRLLLATPRGSVRAHRRAALQLAPSLRRLPTNPASPTDHRFPHPGTSPAVRHSPRSGSSPTDRGPQTRAGSPSPHLPHAGRGLLAMVQAVPSNDLNVQLSEKHVEWRDYKKRHVELKELQCMHLSSPHMVNS
ncbi:hypothetical protein C2845_PM15G14730 [Panicum miliaceum]|uniref:Uncharacterized protein n=1 Tax=Panicum miliaceum TaxID=4540 RepID=A0A3L6Q5Y0_PANMI|nr:hypothetical protein C2845_PM15G14730 [Panicum miliaceum]